MPDTEVLLGAQYVPTACSVERRVLQGRICRQHAKASSIFNVHQVRNSRARN